MPPKSQDSTILNAIRLAKTQPVTFGRGLIRTDDNSVLGYVSDLNNMEVDRNGNVRRRKGTVAMNSGKLNDKWYFLESYQIAGVPILFGLSYKRELWAWIDTWPEVDIKVCDKNTYGRFPHYSANSTDPVFNTWVSFSRGSSFHVLKTDRHITIVNNLNDAIRIYSKGCFALAAYKEDVTQVFAKEDIEAVRDNEELELAMYLSIKDVTNKIIEPAITIKTDDTGPLIEGTVQFASINEEGTAGRFTDLQKIDTASPVFSIFDGLYSRSDIFSFNNKKILKASDGVQSTQVAVTRPDFDGTYTAFKSQWTPEYPTTGYNISKTICCLIVKEDNVGDRRVFLILPENKEIEDNPFSFIELSNLWIVMAEDKSTSKPVGKHLGKKVITIKESNMFTNGSSNFNVDMTKIDSISYDLEDEDYNWIFNQNMSSSKWYEIDINSNDIFKNIRTGYGKITFNNGNINQWDKTSAQDKKFTLMAAFIEFYYTTSEPDKYRIDEVALEYDLGVLNDEFAVFKHESFNTWSVSGTSNGILSTDIQNINSKLDMELSIYGDSEKVITSNIDNKAIDFLKNGYSWCVKNKDSVISKNQVGILNKNEDDVLYSMPYSQLPENINSIAYELKPCYLPIISLHGSTLVSYIDQDKNREVFYDVQYAFNV
ncbi:MAG TPA: hypothetical protein PLZ43_08170, partial [bacterium]|nr:hypothetical protein [bacterium]